MPPLRGDEVKEVFAAGSGVFPVNGKNRYDARTTDQLLAGLSSWSPVMRKRSAQALGRREGDFVPTLLKLLASPDRNTRYGACEALGWMGPRADVAAPELQSLFNDPDPWMQSLACCAVASLSPEVRKASENDLLALAARNNPADPRGMTQRAVAAALFDPNSDLRQPGIPQHSLEGVDRKLLYPAMETLLQNDDALARLHIREGVPLCVSVMEWDRWSVGDRGPACMRCLRQYGMHAKEVLPQLQEMSRRAAGKNKELDKLIADIETSTDAPTLVSMKDFIAHASANLDHSNNIKKISPEELGRTSESQTQNPISPDTGSAWAGLGTRSPCNGLHRQKQVPSSGAIQKWLYGKEPDMQTRRNSRYGRGAEP